MIVGSSWLSRGRHLITAVMAAGLAGGSLILAGNALAAVDSTPASAAGAAPFSFVANFDGNSVTEFAQGAAGNATPVATISGPQTGINQPEGVVLDSSGNLFVANNGGNSVTEYAKGATGNATPIATISGSKTGLSSPDGLKFDSAGTLFVVDSGNNSVTEYAKGANGNVPPTTTISGPATGLGGPGGIVLDASENLFVSNGNTPNSVTEYAKGASGNATPIATITGPSTGLDTPEHMVIDSAAHLFVANLNGNSVTEYAKGATGDATPIATIIGNKTGLNSDEGLALDTSENLYVTNGNTPSVTEYAKGANGNVPPVAANTSSSLNGPSGITLATGAPPPSTATPVVSSPQFGVPNQTDVFRVAANGTIEVNWVDGAGAWQGPLAMSAPGLASPGAHLAASRQFGIPNQTDVFVVDHTGTMRVLWVNGAGVWQGPLAISPSGFAPPGAHLAASNQFGIPSQTDVFVSNNTGTLKVVWVQNAGTWQGPLSISPTGLAPAGAGLATSNQFGIPNQTDVFVSNHTGTLKVVWVQNAGTWQGPLSISPTGLAPAGSELAAGEQFGIPPSGRPIQTDLFVVDTSGNLKVVWVQNAGTWQGPLMIGPPGFATAGAPLTTSNQFGIPSQTDVWVVDTLGHLVVMWVKDAGFWQSMII